MEKITSFTIDHNKLVPGLYVSRKDNVGEYVVTTFDIRMTNPNVRSKQASGKLAALGYTNIVEFGGISTWPGEIVTD